MQQTDSSIEKQLDYWRKVYSFIKVRNAWGSHASHLNYWRRLIFVVSALSNYKLMSSLLDFFAMNSLRHSIVTAHPSILEQTTRQWLYHRATLQERTSLSKEHFLFLQSRFSHKALQQIYLREGIILWNQQYKEDTPLSLKLHYDRFYRKEGLIAVTFSLGENRIYSVSFWVATNTNGELALWIGALQGSQGQSQAIRNLTKHFYGYRPKNLMIYVIRAISRQLQLGKIYAVSNYGSYVNHRLHANRRLKTSLDEFWTETGGTLCSDPRFFELPCMEHRKNLQEVESHKRNLYRKRFALLDKIDAEITKSLEPYVLP